MKFMIRGYGNLELKMELDRVANDICLIESIYTPEELSEIKYLCAQLKNDKKRYKKLLNEFTRRMKKDPEISFETTYRRELDEYNRTAHDIAKFILERNKYPHKYTNEDFWMILNRELENYVLAEGKIYKPKPF